MSNIFNPDFVELACGRQVYTMRVYDLDGLPIKFLHLNDLIRAKKASGRAKDQDDIEHLER